MNTSFSHCKAFPIVYLTHIILEHYLPLKSLLIHKQTSGIVLCFLKLLTYFQCSQKTFIISALWQSFCLFTHKKSTMNAQPTSQNHRMPARLSSYWLQGGRKYLSQEGSAENLRAICGHFPNIF